MDLRDKYGASKSIFNEVICPVCKQPTLDSYWICENCFWEYDGTYSEDEYSDANKSSIRQYKQEMRKSLDFMLKHSSHIDSKGWVQVEAVCRELFIGRNFLHQIADASKGEIYFDKSGKKIKARKAGRSRK